jgi:site-specific DNA-adenine methylase
MIDTQHGREPLRSFLKWAGGKTRTALLLALLAPDDSKTCIEPFLQLGP